MVNQQRNGESLQELALFAGAGGGILGGKLLGWRTVCAVERDAYAAQVLAQRQNDGVLKPFPIWSDVQTFDGRRWRGLVDVVSGGFPCQDISCAGKGAGITGARSGMWSHMARIIGEVRPRYAFIENSPMLVTRGLGVVLSDLAALGYDAEWGCISAADCGAPHERDRIWIVACDTNSNSQSVSAKHDETSGMQEYATGRNNIPSHAEHNGNGWREQLAIGINRKWPVEPELGRVVNGMAHRMDRLKAIGNGQVSRVAATAFTILRGRLES